MTSAEALALNKTFLVDISRWIAASKLAPTTVLRKVLFDLSTAIVIRTPVDTGRLRSNWQFGTDEIPTGVDGDGGQSALSAGAAAAQAGHIHYIVNNLPYASVIEYGQYPSPPKNPTGKTSGGYSIQAPQGMVRITALEAHQFFEKAIAEVRSGG